MDIDDVVFIFSFTVVYASSVRHINTLEWFVVCMLLRTYLLAALAAVWAVAALHNKSLTASY